MDPVPFPGQPVSSGIAASPRPGVGAPRNDGQTDQNQQGLTFAAAKVRPLQTAVSGHPEVEAGKMEAGKETAEIEVVPESPEISPELAEHVERVVRGEIELPGPIEVGTHEGQPVTIEPSASQQPNIVLPLTRADFTAGPGQPVSSSWRWLYEFVKRIILMFPGRAVYRAG